MMNKTNVTILLIYLAFTTCAFAGELGNNCTTSLSEGSIIKTKCEINEIYKGKQYCFGSQSSKEAFLISPDTVISKATAFYQKNIDTEREKISQEEALKQINSKSCDLSNKDAGYLIFNKMDLSHCNMQNVSFFGAELQGANLSGANLQGAYLNLARLENADFNHANLSNAIIFQAIFSKTNFAGANLTNARMIGTLGNVDMHGANIQKGRFGLDVGNQPMGQMKFDSVGGNFAGANFEGADLNIASFAFANLTGANLRNTNLYRADLSQADLTGADITGAQMKDAILDSATMSNVKGIEFIKGYNEAKGKCKDCTKN